MKKEFKIGDKVIINGIVHSVYKGKNAVLVSTDKNDYYLNIEEVEHNQKEPKAESQEVISKNFIKDNGDKTLKEVFPELFVVKLEVGKWYKGSDNEIVCYQGDDLAYGVTENGYWYYNKGWEFNSKYKSWQLAAPEEVESALIAESKKRGFKEGVYFTTPKMKYNEICSGKIDLLSNGILYFGSGAIFNCGHWAEIIPTITIKEAEEKLNCKIV